MRCFAEIKRYAITYSNDGGQFAMKVGNRSMRIIASWGGGWDHVSVSLPHRCPTWEEMEAVKRAFFKPDELAVQYNLPPSKHISLHPNCLHLWRPQDQEIPLPPEWMV